MKRSRAKLVFLIIILIVFGLASRRYLPHSTSAIGDILWAIVLFLSLAFLFPRLSTEVLSLSACLVATIVESSHLLGSEIISTISKTLPGRLLIGQGFSVLDLFWYALGIGIAALVDAHFREQITAHTDLHPSP